MDLTKQRHGARLLEILSRHANPSAVLEALPAELRDKSCLCPRCAQVEAQL